MISPSIISIAYLLILSTFFFGTMCIVRVPEDKSAAFYLIAFDLISTLAVYGMYVSIIELLVRFGGVLYECGMDRQNEKNKVLISYYTNKEKILKEEAISTAAVIKSHMETLDMAKEALKTVMENLAAQKSNMETLSMVKESLMNNMKTLSETKESLKGVMEDLTAVKAYANAIIAASEVANLPMDASPKPKHETSSSEASSICSAARTE